MTSRAVMAIAEALYDIEGNTNTWGEAIRFHYAESYIDKARDLMDVIRPHFYREAAKRYADYTYYGAEASRVLDGWAEEMEAS